MDLFGCTRTCCIGGKQYELVIADDFSTFTWLLFLSIKYGTYKYFFKNFVKNSNEKGFMITKIRSDHNRDFENEH